MTSQSLQTQLEKLQSDVEKQREEIRLTETGRSGVPHSLIPVVAANEEKIEALKKQIENAELAERERERYLASPEYKKDLKDLEVKQSQLLELNTKYCQEGQRLLEKIQAMHKLDAEIQGMRRKFGPAAGPLMGRGEFTQLNHLEQGLRKAAEVGRFVAAVKAQRKS